jgi:hypothetical protein
MGQLPTVGTSGWELKWKKPYGNIIIPITDLDSNDNLRKISRVVSALRRFNIDFESVLTESITTTLDVQPEFSIERPVIVEPLCNLFDNAILDIIKNNVEKIDRTNFIEYDIFQNGSMLRKVLYANYEKIIDRHDLIKFNDAFKQQLIDCQMRFEAGTMLREEEVTIDDRAEILMLPNANDQAFINKLIIALHRHVKCQIVPALARSTNQKELRGVDLTNLDKQTAILLVQNAKPEVWKHISNYKLDKKFIKEIIKKLYI